jgi:hypothetical protein
MLKTRIVQMFPKHKFGLQHLAQSFQNMYPTHVFNISSNVPNTSLSRELRCTSLLGERLRGLRHGIERPVLESVMPRKKLSSITGPGDVITPFAARKKGFLS